MSATTTMRLGENLRQKLKTAVSRVRISGLQGKLIIPYVVLTLVLAAVGIYIITRLVTSTIRERLVNQLYEAGRVASDSVVRQERAHLENLRLVVFMDGVSAAVARQDADSLQTMLLPVVLNSRIDALTAVDTHGIEILTLGRNPVNGEYVDTRGTDFSDQVLVKNVLAGKVDEKGDKYVGLLNTNFGKALFTSAPIYDDHGSLVGSMLIGTRLDTILAGMKEQALADVVLLDERRELLGTTLPQDRPDELASSMMVIPTGKLAEPHDLMLNGRLYQMVFTPLQARSQQLGYLGVVLSSNFVVSAEATSRDVFSLVFALGTVMIIIIGFLLSQSIAKPILTLRSVTQAVASGDLDQNLGLNRSDEIGDLADAFDTITSTAARANHRGHAPLLGSSTAEPGAGRYQCSPAIYPTPAYPIRKVSCGWPANGRNRPRCQKSTDCHQRRRRADARG